MRERRALGGSGWVNIFAATGKSMDQIPVDHYATYGRTYYSRHDYEAVETEKPMR